ncbi:MAG TPA: hypothetical protein PKK95_09240 [Vicinamibacterales bacterium]|nr:hypothetical protein [Vicinamibacterales bacterium]
MLRRWITFLVATAIALAPVQGAATRFALLASQAQTASANSSAVQVATITQAVVGIDITAGSGTVSDFDLWLEVSDDGGTSWYPLAPDVVIVDSTRAATWNVDADHAYIVDSKASTTAEKYLAVFKQVPADYVRLRWTLTGTTPSLTFSADMVGK